MLNQFGRTTEEGRRNLVDFTLNGLKDSKCGAPNADLARLDNLDRELSGSPCERNPEGRYPLLTWKSASLEEVIGSVCQMAGIDETVLAGRDLARNLAETRGTAAWLARECRTTTLSELARRWERDISSLSRAARRIESRFKIDSDLQELLAKITADLAEEVSLRWRLKEPS